MSAAIVCLAAERARRGLPVAAPPASVLALALRWPGRWSGHVIALAVDLEPLAEGLTAEDLGEVLDDMEACARRQRARREAKS